MQVSWFLFGVVFPPGGGGGGGTGPRVMVTSRVIVSVLLPVAADSYIVIVNLSCFGVGPGSVTPIPEFWVFT